MSSAFMSAEYMSLEEKQPKQPAPQEEAKPVSHPDVQSCVKYFEKLTEDPSDKKLHMKFIEKYISLLENNKGDILGVFQTASNIEENNIFTFLYKNGNAQQNAWGLFEFFVTVVNICTQVAQNPELNDQQKFILQCVMLSNDNVAPVFSYTDLLHSHHSKSSDFYRDLNEEFCSVYSKMTPEYVVNNEEQIEKMEDQLEHGNDDKTDEIVSGNVVSNGKKIGIAVFIMMILLIISGLVYYFLVYKKQMVSPDILADF